MQEDVLGTRETVTGDRYETCTRCGRPIMRAAAVSPHLAGEGPTPALTIRQPVPGVERPIEATRDAPPPLLCDDCARDLATGEPLELEGEEDSRPNR